MRLRSTLNALCMVQVLLLFDCSRYSDMLCGVRGSRHHGPGFSYCPPLGATRVTRQLTSCSFALPDAAATVPQHALMSTRTLIFAILCLACTMTKLNACLLEELALQPHVTSPLSEPRLCKHPVLLLYYLHCLHNACAWTEGTTMVWATPLARGTRCSLTHACIAAPCCWWIPIECSMFLRPDYLDDLALQRPTVFSSGCSFAARTQVSADRLES